MQFSKEARSDLLSRLERLNVTQEVDETQEIIKVASADPESPEAVLADLHNMLKEAMGEPVVPVEGGEKDVKQKKTETPQPNPAADVSEGPDLTGETAVPAEKDAMFDMPGDMPGEMPGAMPGMEAPEDPGMEAAAAAEAAAEQATEAAQAATAAVEEVAEMAAAIEEMTQGGDPEGAMPEEAMAPEGGFPPEAAPEGAVAEEGIPEGFPEEGIPGEEAVVPEEAPAEAPGGMPPELAANLAQAEAGGEAPAEAPADAPAEPAAEPEPKAEAPAEEEEEEKEARVRLSKNAQAIETEIVEALASAVVDDGLLDLALKLASVRERTYGGAIEKTAHVNPFLQRFLEDA
jgi:hypothetical protein